MLAGEKKAECVGSLILNEDPKLSFQSSVDKINHKVHTVRLQGCGCFRLYQRKRYKGRSIQIGTQGISRHNMVRIGSIAKEVCGSYNINRKYSLKNLGIVVTKPKSTSSMEFQSTSSATVTLNEILTTNLTESESTRETTLIITDASKSTTIESGTTATSTISSKISSTVSSSKVTSMTTKGAELKATATVATVPSFTVVSTEKLTSNQTIANKHESDFPSNTSKFSKASTITLTTATPTMGTAQRTSAKPTATATSKSTASNTASSYSTTGVIYSKTISVQGSPAPGTTSIATMAYSTTLSTTSITIMTTLTSTMTASTQHTTLSSESSYKAARTLTKGFTSTSKNLSVTLSEPSTPASFDRKKLPKMMKFVSQKGNKESIRDTYHEKSVVSGALERFPGSFYTCFTVIAGFIFSQV